MRKISTIDLTYENQLIKADFFSEFEQLYDSNLLMNAPVIDRLEHELASACGTAHCCLTGSGSMALHVAASAVGVRPGDEVIVPANTFLATAVAMHHAGARVILADVDPETWNLSPQTVRRVITQRTKAICLVHLYGNLADPEDFAEFGVPVLEDASHAFGGILRGKRAGNLGTIAGFSAGPIKGFGGLGHAGFITFNQGEYRLFIRGYINNGQTRRHYAEFIGHNFRIDSVNALFLLKKLRQWEELDRRKQDIIAVYDEFFGSEGIRRQARLQDGVSSLWVYVIRVDKRIRDEVVRYLREERDIDTLVQYTFTINQMPMWDAIAAKPASVPVSEQLSKEILSLPCHPGLSRADAEYVCDSVAAAVGHSN